MKLSSFWKRIVRFFSSGITQVVITVCILIILSIVAYKDTYSLPPTGGNTWSQADHYAIALNYAEQGLNYFKPRSYILNPYEAFAPASLDTLEGITRYDSPLGEYLVGCTMKITGKEESFIFRCFTLVTCIIGLVFLFLMM